MFDNDFESMLEAVCEAVDSEIPQVLNPQPKQTQSQSIDTTNFITKRSRNDYVDESSPAYVPPQLPTRPTYDRSKFIFNNFKSNVIQEKLTEVQIERARRAINNAKAQHGAIRTDKINFRYMDKIYSTEAAEALLLSGTSYWPGADLDDILEGMLLLWLKNKNPDHIREYVAALSEAINESNCMEGIYLRLNLNTVTHPLPDSIRIHTHFGTVSQTKPPHKSAFTGELRNKMKSFLHREGQYIGNLNTIYDGLARIKQEYTLEQTLLSWMGYIVVRAMVENSKGQSKGRQLLIEDSSVAANTR